MHHFDISDDLCVCICLFSQVDEQQLQKQLDEIKVILDIRKKLNVNIPVSHAGKALK